jgi:hypothetical protein
MAGSGRIALPRRQALMALLLVATTFPSSPGVQAAERDTGAAHMASARLLVEPTRLAQLRVPGEHGWLLGDIPRQSDSCERHAAGSWHIDQGAEIAMVLMCSYPLAGCPFVSVLRNPFPNSGIEFQ